MAPEKRERLFQAARDEFAARGFSHASLNRIIGAVGMSKSSFYHYFQDKADLFRQTFTSTLAPIIELQQTIDIDRLTRDSLWPTILASMGQALQITQTRPEIITAGRMFYKSREVPEGAALTGEYLGALSGWITGIIHRGQEVGAFRNDLPDDLLIDMLMAMGMTMDNWVLNRWDQFDEDARSGLVVKFIDIVQRFLAPPEDG